MENEPQRPKELASWESEEELSLDGRETVCAKVDIERILTNSWEVEEAPGGLFSEKFR